MKINGAIIGQTDDGKLVMAGLFKFYDTHGLPFSTIFDRLQEENCIPCWKSLIKECLCAGWGLHKIKATLREAISDSYRNLSDPVKDKYGVELRDRVIALIEALEKRYPDNV